MICSFLERARIPAGVCTTLEALCSSINESTGAVLISDESLTPSSVFALNRVLSGQPPWSDIPLIITTTGGEATEVRRGRLRIVEPLGSVSLLQRPVEAGTLVSTVSAALRARRRQYQLRDNFAEKERLVRQLEQSNEDLAEFAHVVSHDLQAPIRLVSLYSELLSQRCQSQLDRVADEYIRTIRSRIQMMEALIRTLLDYTTAGRDGTARRQVDLSCAAADVLTTLQPTIAGIRAEVSCDSLPTVKGDPLLLQQLLQNLLDNALKYRDTAVMTRVLISAKREEDGWNISVRDNGPGIAPEDHNRIFLPLKRLHGRDITGTGMGLALCRKIVERHGGRIWVESELGHGATFCFTLPDEFESTSEEHSVRTFEGVQA